MYIPKKYGMSKKTDCPFCGNMATTQNKQKIPVCNYHKDFNLEDVKCLCGKYLELKSGKWGPYYNCINCGNINFNKARNMGTELKNSRKEFKPLYKIQKKSSSNSSSKKKLQQNKSSAKKEITISSDELDFFYS